MEDRKHFAVIVPDPVWHNEWRIRHHEFSRPFYPSGAVNVGMLCKALGLIENARDYFGGDRRIVACDEAAEISRSRKAGPVQTTFTAGEGTSHAPGKFHLRSASATSESGERPVI